MVTRYLIQRQRFHARERKLGPVSAGLVDFKLIIPLFIYLFIYLFFLGGGGGAVVKCRVSFVAT